MSPLSVLFGVIVGFSLGLTGGGGAIFAVPLLVYGLAVVPREAVGISLAAVGVTSFVGFLGRWRARQVEIRTGLVFAGAGMLGAPVGSWVSGLIPEAVLLTLFAILMLIVALRMWSKAAATASAGSPVVCSTEAADVDGPACRRDINGNLLLTSRCVYLLMVVGVATGILSGLFGVGGGFVIVPALVLFSGMAIHRAVGTSLLVITLVSISGIASHLFVGRPISVKTTALFVVGGVTGMLLGDRAGRRLSGPALQKVFAGAIVAVALFVIVRTVFLP
ncbi:MAG: sulfite exporter TauE/SafE family protein [Candidatus Eisenbacteria bacterium]|nr:sulfite exporter TauE/SafE family protein [Candidatus Eisenbacteria bacterium]